MARAGILFLDLATLTGWARERPGREPDYDTVNLYSRSRHPGAKKAILADWLGRVLEHDIPEMVGFESPIPAMPAKEDGKGFSNVSTLKHQLHLGGTVELLCYRWDVEVFEMATSTARSWFCGNGRAKKPDVMEECRRRGWDPKDDNAGDALAGLDASIHLFRFTEYAARYPHIVAQRSLRKR